MYYLRKEDRAIYKHSRLSRFYRGEFKGIDGRYQGMKVYRCKTLERILELRDTTQAYCEEVFDVYDESGKVEIPFPTATLKEEPI